MGKVVYCFPKVKGDNKWNEMVVIGERNGPMIDLRMYKVKNIYVNQLFWNILLD